MAVDRIRRILDFLARMGLSVRDDVPRVIDPAARTWGNPLDGFVLSIEQLPKEDPGAVPGLSVVLRNVGSSPRVLVTPGWLSFFHIDIEAQPTPFGRELLKSERQTEQISRTIGAGQLLETQIPIGSLFLLEPKERYKAQVSCNLPDGASLSSNPISVVG